MKCLIDRANATQRVDRYLRKVLPRAPLSFIYRLIRQRDVRVNGMVVKGSVLLKEGDLLEVFLHKELESSWKREPLPKASGELQILYEDERLLLLFKPRGLKTTPDTKGEDSLVLRAQYYLKNEHHTVYRASPISRLDRNTPGMVLFVKTMDRMRELQSLHHSGLIKKYYLAMIFGTMKNKLTHSMRVIRDEKTRTSRIEESGKEARTNFVPLAISDTLTLVEAELISGRTHQIRLALSQMGTPIVGDAKYGDGKGSQWLLAYRLDIPEGSWTFIPTDFRARMEKEFPHARLPADNCAIRTIRL